MLKLSDLRKRRDDGDEHWQLSLADMMTLLLCFFVLMVSVSRLDMTRFEKVAGSMEKAMTRERGKPAEKPAVPEPLAKERPPVEEPPTAPTTPEVRAAAAPPGQRDIDLLRREIEAKLAGKTGQAEIIQRGETLAVSLDGAAFFDLASAEIRPASLPLLTDIADSLKGLPVRITVEGHTDNKPMESWLYPSNWELSSARASRVARFMTDHGVPKQRLAVMGLADTRPLAPNDGPDGKPIPANQAKNRRVVILVSP
ncbi:MAG: flagellar motor protein MotB [Desulfovibrionaceae bacterium]|nr:flagellar motor protein MotB [Desulfovibrionaceae bacterium]